MKLDSSYRQNSKYWLYKTALMHSKPTCFLRHFLLGVLVLSTVLGRSQGSDSLNYKTLEGMELIEALRYIDRILDLAFSYNPDALRSIKVPEMGGDETSVSDFLQSALRGTNFTHKIIGGTYVIIPNERKALKSGGTQRQYAITGLVRDSQTKEALPYALISVLDSKYGSTANLDGHFTLLNVPGKIQTIEVSYLGYVSRKVVLEPPHFKELLIFEMEAKERNLPSVEIIASSPEIVTIDRLPGQLTFNPVEIGKLPNLGEKDLFGALRWLPGIKSGQDAVGGLQIRGGSSDQNLILFDGITVYHVDHFFGLLSAFNSNVVKNVQVSKGGYEAKYGGRAAGVINITGIDGNKVKPSILVEGTLLSGNIRAELPLVEGKASLVVAARRAYTNIIQSPTYKRMFRTIFNSSVPGNAVGNTDVFDGDGRPDFTYNDLNVKVNFKPSQKDAISMSYYQGMDRVNILFSGKFDSFRRNSQDDTQWGNNGGSFKWSRQWNSKFFSYANFGISKYQSSLTAEEAIFQSSTDSLLSKIFFEQNTTVSDHTLRLDNTWEINSKYKAEFGYWYTKYGISSQSQDQFNLLTDSIQSADLHAGYLEMNRKIGDAVLSSGLRTSYYTRTGKVLLSPRVSTSIPLHTDLSLKGSFGIYYQMIRRLNERSLYFSIPESWVLAGNSTVSVLRNDHYSLGFTYSRKKWIFDVEAYHKFERGSAEFLFPGIGNPFDLSEFGLDGNRKIFGVDVLIKKSFGDQHILVGYTYLDASSRYNDVNDGRYFKSSGISAHEFNLVYNFDFRKWDFSAGFIAAQGGAYTPVLGTYILTLPSGQEEQFLTLGATNSARLDFYHRLDLSVSYSIMLKNSSLEVGASVYNLYNHLAIKYVDYFTTPNLDTSRFTLSQRNILSLGFTPSLFLKLKI